uniref:Uncharacterized protein n=1 Tax=Arundo donax TaxID=35708 RepID=A0A0A9FB97_ARUDO
MLSIQLMMCRDMATWQNYNMETTSIFQDKSTHHLKRLNLKETSMVNSDASIAKQHEKSIICDFRD